MIGASVEDIHIAPGAGRHMKGVESVYARPGIGLEGDRYALGLGYYSNDRRVSRDITLIQGEAIDQLEIERGISLEPGETRRNVTTRGVNLNDLVGRRFFIGEVLCVGTRLCNPCQYLAHLLHKPVVRPLVGRGGLRADLLTEGRIHVGDAIRVMPPIELVMGTTNREKARQCELALAGLDLELRPLSEVIDDAPVVEERSSDARQNARKKARVYAERVELPVLGVDFALSFDGVDDELQPGAMVRRLRGSDVPFNDEQLIRYYSALISRHGGELTGRWQAAFALATGSSMTEIEVTFKRTFVATPSPERKPGYPLASLQLASGLGYISQLADDAMAYPELAPPLRRFVTSRLSKPR